ncbi:hypothetical protein BGZ58_003485, partial [Dissophora ornata]
MPSAVYPAPPSLLDSATLTLSHLPRILRACTGPSFTGIKDIDSEVKALAGERVKIKFLARQLFLQHLLDNNPALEPRQFFREQTVKSGALIIRDLVRKVKEYSHDTIRAMLSKVESNIQRHLLPRQLGVVIALDAAQAAANDILSGKLISP